MKNKQYKNAVSGRRGHEVSPIVIQLPAWGHEVEQSIVSAQEADIRVQNNWNDWNVPQKKFVYMSGGGGVPLHVYMAEGWTVRVHGKAIQG